MEEYKSILKLIDETLENNNNLLEHYRKASTVYEAKITELQQKVDTLEAANRELLKRIEVAE
jgi:hypothetical protein